MRFSPGLQGLRGVAILLVLACHVGLLGGGWVGVDVFFALSGFLITRLLLDRPTLGSFYARRARRLVPGLVVLLVGVSVVQATVYWQWLPLSTLLGAVTYSTNFMRFDGTSMPLVGQLWSLAQEEQFYLLWPLALYAVPARWRMTLAVGLGLACVARLGALTYSGATISRLYFGPDTHALPMVLGCTMALIPRTLRPRTARLVGLAGVLGVGIVAVKGSIPLLTTAEYARYEVLAAVGGVCLASAALSEPQILRNQALQRLGLYSYGIYLWHPALILWLPDGWAVVLAVVIAAASYHLVELPVREWRARLRLARPDLEVVYLPASRVG